MAYTKFNKLPTAVQERLLSRQKGEREDVVVKTCGILTPVLLFAAALLWFALLFYLANDYLWSRFQLISFALVSIAASYFLIQNAYFLLRWFRSPSKCCLLVTPHYVIDVYFNDVRFWNLEQLITVNGEHQHQNGVYTSTQITLSFEDGVRTFKIKNLDQAEDTIERITYLRKLFIEASARGDAAYLNKEDDFAEANEQTKTQSKAKTGEGVKRAALFAGAAAMTALIIFAASRANNYYDDNKSWGKAASINRASSFRTYLETHPNGRRIVDAQQNLQSLYDAAEKNFQASLNKDYDKDAAAVVLEMLEYAKRTQNFHVNVQFERHNEIPANVVEQLKKDYGLKKVLPVGDTFSDEKMSRREVNLLTVIADAFRQIIPEDILEITNQCTGDCINFAVVYRVNSQDSYYYDSRQKNIPEAERVTHPGIAIDWDFGVNIPNQPRSYNFTLASEPAEEISYDSDTEQTADDKVDFAKEYNIDKDNIYDSMTTSAFDDFKRNLIHRMGIESAINGAENEKVDAVEKVVPANGQFKSK